MTRKSWGPTTQPTTPSQPTFGQSTYKKYLNHPFGLTLSTPSLVSICFSCSINFSSSIFLSSQPRQSLHGNFPVYKHYNTCYIRFYRLLRTTLYPDMTIPADMTFFLRQQISPPSSLSLSSLSLSTPSISIQVEFLAS